MTSKSSNDRMRVQATRESFVEAPAWLLDLGWSRQSRPSISPGREYAAYGLSVWRGSTSFLVIDDDNMPRFLPAWLFRQVDSSMPPGWICSCFEGEVTMVIGPAFIAESVEAYTDLVELVPDQVRRFREYVQSLTGDQDAVV